MKFLLSLIIVPFFILTGIAQAIATTVLEGNISLIDKIPDELYGSWVVASVATRNSNPELYDNTSVDLWTLKRHGNIIILSNPLSGASASVTVEEVKDNTIKFSRQSMGDDEIGLETPTIILNGEMFDGTDKMVIKKYKNNRVYREDIIEYRIKGKKVSSEDLGQIFNY